jgi:hypothetical protein
VAIIRVSHAIANGDTLTLPSHQRGDLLVAVIYRADSSILPPTPSQWQRRLTSSSAGVHTLFIASKYAASSADSFGTWSGATQVAVVVYRSDAGQLLFISGGSLAGSGSTSVSYNAVGVNAAGNISALFIGCAGVTVNNSNAEGAPSTMTNITSIAGASIGELTVHDTNAEQSSFSTAVFTTDSTVSWRTVTHAISESNFEILPAGGLGFNRSMLGGFDE